MRMFRCPSYAPARPGGEGRRRAARVGSPGRWGAAAIPLLVASLPAGPAAGQTIAGINQAIGTQNTILRRFTPPPRVGSVEITVEDQRKRVTDAEAARQRFRLRSLAVDGAETLPPGALAPLWRDRIGEEISVADLYAIADAIDAAYVRAGYFSMTIVPVQDFASGEIRLRVYESYVASVEITSDIPGMDQRLAPYIDRIVAMRPIRIKEAERILSLMSDLGGLTIEGTFYRPEVPTGGGSLKLDVGFDRAAGMIGLDNFGTDEVGPLELAANVVLNDLFGLFDTTSLVAVTVPDTPSELAMAQLSQDFPVGRDGLAVGYSFTYLKVQPGGDAKQFDVVSNQRVGTAYVSYPFIRTLDHNLFGRLEFNARNDDLDVGGAHIARTEARWLHASLSYDRELTLGSIEGSAGIAQGVGNNIDRPGVPDDYRFMTADIDYTRPLGELTSLRIRAAGQYAATPIPVAAQFSLGGEPFAWGFDGNTLSGDSAAATAIELSRAVDTGFAALDGLSVTGFVDYGIVWKNDVAPAVARDTLGSVGLGVSGMLSQTLTFQVIAAVPWDTGDTIDDPGSRIFFRVGLPL